jgi:hypothetical protein
VAASNTIRLEIESLVRARLAALRSKPFGELQALPEVHTDQVLVHEKPVNFSVFREAQESGRVLIAVQAFRKTLGGMSTQICVEGFLAAPSGELTEATEELLWDYM